MIAFQTYHPSVLFLYYVSVIAITIFFLHPFILFVSFVSSLLLFYRIKRGREFFKDFGFYMVFFILITLTNPIFVHKGETILFFLNGKPVTLEALYYGMAIACMLTAIMYWSKIYSELMSTDKVLYLFGSVVPKLALLLSMAFRFVPLFTEQVKKVHRTQKTLGFYTSDSITDRLLNSLRVFSSIMKWSLEHAIEQADAMRARGYGLKGRTNYSYFTFRVRDSLVVGFLLFLIAVIVYGTIKGVYSFYYYPAVSSLKGTLQQGRYMFVVLILTIFPFAVETKESLWWNYLRQKM